MLTIVEYSIYKQNSEKQMCLDQRELTVVGVLGYGDLPPTHASCAAV